jgi:hypothetical protein
MDSVSQPAPTFGPIIEDALARIRRGPTSGADRMRRYVLDVLLDHYSRDELPTNGRFIFYELEQRGIVRKDRKGDPKRGAVDDPRQTNVTEALMQLRKGGIVPWSWIVDETRTLTDWNHAPTVTDFISEANERARLNPWEPDAPPLLLVEARATGGVLQTLASQYVCPIAATNGQAGGFLYTDIAPLLQEVDREVFYLGDRDLQGYQIEDHTRRVLERETGGPLSWRRLALTQEQIDERGIEPRWKTDTRYSPTYHGPAWEAEALTQSVIVQIVTDALDGLIPERLDDVLERETDERDHWREILAGGKETDDEREG